MWPFRGIRDLRTLRLNRHWRAFFYGLCAFAVIGVLVLWLAPAFAGLFLFALYAIPSNSVIPIPHEPGVLFFARYYDPLWIALVGSIGGGLVGFADYGIIETAMKHPRMNAARGTRPFRWAMRWMSRAPFAIIAVFALIPVLPVYIVRVLAPASGYPAWRYVLAQTLGRFPRFYVLAYLGASVHVPGWALLAMFVVMFGAFYVSSPAEEEEPEPEPDDADEPEPESAPT